MVRYTESLAASGDGTARQFVGDFICAVSGTWTGTYELKVSVDAGTTYDTYASGTANTTTALRVFNPDQEARWRITFTRSSGTLAVAMVGKSG